MTTPGAGVMTAYDFPPPTVPTHTATCPDCGWTTQPCISPARAAYVVRVHKCGSKKARHDLGITATTRASADTAEDVEFILDWHPWTNPADLAERLGYSDTGGLYIALKRAGRGDLLDQLARNAQVAS